MKKEIASPKTENQPVLIKGYAPKTLDFPKNWFYIFLRMLHLLATASILPLAIIYGKSNASGLQNFPQWLGWLMAFGAAIWTLLYIGLEGYSYPTRLNRSFLFTGAFYLNIAAGLKLSGFSFVYSAYQVFISAILAQFLFVLGIIAWYSYLKFKNHPEGKELPNWYLVFLISIIAALGILLDGLSSPIINQFMKEKNIFIIISSAFFFFYHTFSDGQVLWKGSIFNKKLNDDQLQSQLHDKWSAFSAFAIIISLLASMIIGLWDIK
jgi:hypothetical protein